ncbi:hypothetical protein HanIR_Chr03g0123481 [Helianthus annuus]|nr:hypothetical protein HanIR_Chr03g0123481 [Helianthus annuus]
MRVVWSFAHKVQVLYAHKYKSLLSLYKQHRTSTIPTTAPPSSPPLPPPSHYRHLQTPTTTVSPLPLVSPHSQ